MARLCATSALTCAVLSCPLTSGNLLTGDPAQNLTLHPQDIVRVFARAEFVDPPQVRISGLVHRPGFYPLTEGMRVGDLVFRAGSVLKFAYLERAELTRRTLGQGGENAIRVEIDLSKALGRQRENTICPYKTLITWWYGKSPISSCSAISNTRTKAASKQGARGAGTVTAARRDR
jgi:protein involved in polysaccharide export with SLBB domain